MTTAARRGRDGGAGRLAARHVRPCGAATAPASATGRRARPEPDDDAPSGPPRPCASLPRSWASISPRLREPASRAAITADDVRAAGGEGSDRAAPAPRVRAQPRLAGDRPQPRAAGGDPAGHDLPHGRLLRARGDAARARRLAAADRDRRALSHDRDPTRRSTRRGVDDSLLERDRRARGHRRRHRPRSRRAGRARCGHPHDRRARERDRATRRGGAVGLALARRAHRAPPIAVSNTGSYGSEAGTPILSPGTSVTLAVGLIAPRALVVDGQVVAQACLHAQLHLRSSGARRRRRSGGRSPTWCARSAHRERLGDLPR